MNRRSFIKTIAVAVTSLSIAPTEFLTPYSPPEQITHMGALTPEMLSEAFLKMSEMKGPKIIIMGPKLYKHVMDLLYDPKEF